MDVVLVKSSTAMRFVSAHVHMARHGRTSGTLPAVSQNSRGGLVCLQDIELTVSSPRLGMRSSVGCRITYVNRPTHLRQ